MIAPATANLGWVSDAVHLVLLRHVHYQKCTTGAKHDLELSSIEQRLSTKVVIEDAVEPFLVLKSPPRFARKLPWVHLPLLG